MPTQNKVYIFRVTLIPDDAILMRGTIKPEKLKSKKVPWREIAIAGNSSLYKFAEQIVKSFDFNFDHCFGFFDNTETIFTRDSKEYYELFTDIPDVEPTGAGSVEKTKISQVWRKAGDKMLFLFDYGDDWRFLAELKTISGADSGKKYPIILEKWGESPEQYPECE